MRFTMHQPERSCHPERLVRGARSVVSALLPVWRPAPPRPDGPAGPHAASTPGPIPYARLRAALGRLRDAPARARRAGGGVRGRQPPRRPRGRAPGRADVLRPATRWRSRPASARSSRIGTLVTDAVLVDEAPARGARGLRLVHALPRRLPDGRARRAGRAGRRRCLSYWTQSRHAAPADVPTRSRTASTAATSARTSARTTPARRGAGRTWSRRARRGSRWSTGWSCPDDELLRRYGRLYVPDRDPRYLRRNALVALGNGPEEHRHLAEPFARGGDPILAPAARRALG